MTAAPAAAELAPTRARMLRDAADEAARILADARREADGIAAQARQEAERSGVAGTGDGPCAGAAAGRRSAEAGPG